MMGIQLAHHAKLGFGRRFRFDQLIGDAERPSRIGQNFFDADAGMHGGQKRFAIVAKSQNAQSGDHGGRPRRGRQAVSAPPVRAGAETGRGDVADAIAEAASIVREQDDRAPRETSDVASAAGAGEALHFVVAMTPGGIEIAEAIDFRCAEKTYVNASLLQQTHHIEHLAALGGAANICGIAHGVKKLGRRRLANDSIFKKSNGTRRMRASRNQEREHRKAHAYEDDFPIENFTRSGSDHKFAEGVGPRGAIGF
jgi:hypothetical protein